MNSQSRPDLPSLALAGLATLVAAGGYWLSDANFKPSAPRSGPAYPHSIPASTDTQPATADNGRVADYDMITARPLFTASRRAAPQRTAAPVRAKRGERSATPATAPLEMPELVGIVFNDSERAAMLRRKGSASVHFVAAGDSFDGWIVEDVASQQVTIGNDDELTVLELERMSAPLNDRQRRAQNIERMRALARKKQKP